MKRFAIVVAALLSGGALYVRPAAADLRVCNQTSFVLYAAVGYEAGVQMLTRGWTRVRPGDCAAALQGMLDQPGYFVYARSSRAHRGPTRAWGGRIRLCAKESNFAIDVPVGAARCASDDAFLVPFASVATGHKAAWTTTLTEAVHFANPAAARTAGIRRLLGDVGYGIDAGSAPGAATQALADFRTRMRLPANAGDADLLDALETEALKTSAPSGYTVCNDGTAEIWAAIGLHVNRSNGARGWWAVPPGACGRILTQPLNVASVYLHVSRIGNPNLVGGPATFCTGSGSFTLLAVAPCRGEGRTVLGFLETPTKGLTGYVAHVGDSGLLPPPPRTLQPRAAH